MVGTSQETVAPLLNPAGPTTGVATAATGTGASILDASAPTNIGVTIKADDSNTDSVYIGSARSIPTVVTGWRLKAGQSLDLAVSDVNQIWAIGGAGAQKLIWMAH